MRDLLNILGIIVLGLALIAAFVYAGRLFTATATPITVTEVRPGVLCAMASTTDGVALSCWKEASHD